MKRFLCALIFLCMLTPCAWADVAIDSSNFPDENFREYISTNFDTDSDGVLSDSEIANVAAIDVSGSNISSLEGIKHFTALTTLNCQNTSLTALDISSNTSLATLNCYNSKLAALDVGSNTALTNISCSAQSVSPLRITETGDSEYPYQLDFTNYMTSAQTANVSVVNGYSGSNSFSGTYADGIAKFASKPSSVTYHYATGYSTLIMDVTISGQASPYSVIEINATNFPGTAFRNYVSRFDTDSNGVLDDSEIAAVTYMSISDDLTSFFWSQSFTVDDTMFMGHSVSGLNFFTALEKLEFKVEVADLDLSQNTALQYLSFDGYVRIENNALTAGCLTELDVSKNTSLISLYCPDNSLTKLDLSNNTALKYLNCGNNCLPALDLHENVHLTDPVCGGQSITSCDSTISENSSYPWQITFSNIMTADQAENVSNVQGFASTSDVEANIDAIYSNGIAQFASFPEKVTYSYGTGCYIGYGTAQNSVEMSVTITNISRSDSAPDYSVKINAANFPDDNFRLYISSNWDADKDGALSESEISAVSWIDVRSMDITSLKGIEHFTYISGLNCENNRITELDLSRNTAVTEVWAMSNDISSINVNNCASLRKLGLHENKLTSLDVSGCYALEELHCGDMSLSTLIIGSKPSLKQLYCYRNQLTALDVTGCPALTQLHFGGNNIANIDLSKCPNIEYLHCWQNQLTALDLSGLPSLSDLNCSSNRLTALDLTNNSRLTSLYCDNNALRMLNIGSLSLTSSNFDGQNFDAVRIYSTGDSSYPYQADFSEFVTSGNVANISEVRAYDSSGAEINVDYQNGTARFASLPSSVTYVYNTGGGNMSVNVTYGENVEVVSNYSPSPSPDNPSPSPDSTSGGKSTSFGGHRYTVYDISMTWTEAKEYCESLGGHLATISNQEEQNAVASIIASGDKSAYWLGGHRDSSGAWYWVDGSAWSYTNWAAGEPDDSGECLQIYAHILYGDSELGKWDNTSDDASTGGDLDIPQHGFICEWDQEDRLEIAIVSVIPEQYTPGLIEKLAKIISVDPGEITLLTSADFDPSEPREPTASMKENARRQNVEFKAKLNTFHVSKEGWYAFMVTVSDDLVGTAVSDLRLFSAEGDEFNDAGFSASFGIMPFVNGISGGLEITNLFGVQLDTLPKQFIAMMLLSSGKSLSVYIVKVLLLLLAGCSAGAGSLIFLAVFIYHKRARKK